jgi:hypothetical protein
MSAINFGATLQRTARLDLADAAFVSGTEQLRPEWLAKIGPIVGALQKERTVLKLVYHRFAGENTAAAHVRLRSVETHIRAAWQQMGNPYRLIIDANAIFERATGSIVGNAPPPVAPPRTPKTPPKPSAGVLPASPVKPVAPGTGRSAAGN